MKKFLFTRFQTIAFGYLISLVAIVAIGIMWTWRFPGDTYGESGLSFAALHYIVNLLLLAVFVVSAVLTSIEWGDANETPLAHLYFAKKYAHKSDGELKFPNLQSVEEETDTAPIKTRKIFKWAIFLLVGYFLYGISKDAFLGGKNVYNTSKIYTNAYVQRTQEKAGFYDKMWKTYYSKDKITNINKETFIQVTKIIMENRADGQMVTWKWVKENQQIPYTEFTKFYEDLSKFIESQREGYFAVEKVCQDIANRHNTLIDTFPNNLYNKVLNRPRINFEYGFTSAQTDEVFRSKQENPN